MVLCPPAGAEGVHSDSPFRPVLSGALYFAPSLPDLLGLVEYRPPPGLFGTTTFSLALGVPIHCLFRYMVRTPSERVANPVPFAAFDLLVDRKFVAKFPKTFIGEFFGPSTFRNRIATRT